MPEHLYRILTLFLPTNPQGIWIPVMRLMREVVREQGRTLVMVTHDDHLAEYADRVFHIIDGRIVKIDVNTTETSDGGERA